MAKRGVRLLLIGLFLAVFVIGGVFAQNETTAGDAGGTGDEIENEAALDESSDESEAGISGAEESGEEDIFGEEFSDAEIETDSGITPDSSFYFVDEFLDRFGDDIEVKEEKVAEIREMIENGDIDSARIALERYNEYADKIEGDANPESRDDARRSASAIRNALREIESETSEEEREEFIDDIIEREGGIVTAVEIATKIKSLCQELSKIDPVEYSRVCRAREDAPNWQKKLDKELTKEQRKEAEQLFGILSQCFATQGRECRCEDISISAFANRCSIVAPLAVQCDAGDENACESMDDATEGMEDLLPDYLQDVMERVEEKFSEEQFDNHIPGECREAGAKTPKECMKVMIRLNAPPECVDELIKRDVQNEREARAICEEIMFKEFAPEECIEAGVKNPRECGELMFRVNAPQECIDAGLTGEQRSDEKRCREIMEGLRGPEGHRGRGGFGGDCRSIENPEERLACYDGASTNVKERFERRGPAGGWPPQCEEAKAFSRESCENVMRGFGEREREKHESFEFRENIRERFKGEFEGEAPPYDCSVMFCRDGQVCSPYRGCLSPEERERELEENFGDERNREPSYGEEGYVDRTARYDCSTMSCGPGQYCDSWQGCLSGNDGYNPDGSSCDEGYEYSSSGCIPFGTGDYGFGEQTPPPSEPMPSEPIQQVPSGPAPAPTTESTGIVPSGSSGGGMTGSVILAGNNFISYYYG